MTGALRRSLVEKVPRDHRESTQRLHRRQLVTGVVVVIGAAVMAFSLRIEPGSHTFYFSTIALAAIWTIGAFASGPLHLGRTLLGDDQPGGRPWLGPLALGAVLAGVFVVGGLLVRQIPPLDHQVQHVLDHAAQGSMPLLVVITVINGVAEELFFRGALYAATTRHAVTLTTIAYTVATLATGNVMLAFAAALLGVLVGLERRATGGILAPIITHVVWSTAMLFILPALFG